MKRKQVRRDAQAGMSLIELMIAMTVLVIGMMGVMVLLVTSISSNNRNKTDTGATMVASMVLDQLSARPANNNGTFTITDCEGTDHTIATTGSATGAGAPLNDDGSVDWEEDKVANYSMVFMSCGDSLKTPYDVRWNVKTVTQYTKIVTVSARLDRSSGNRGLQFALPQTLRTVVGM